MIKKEKVEESVQATEQAKQETLQKFTKEQIISSAVYQGKQDLLNAILENGKEYTKKEVASEIEKYKKGKVT